MALKSATPPSSVRRLQHGGAIRGPEDGGQIGRRGGVETDYRRIADARSGTG
jgi:hypothetical protein